MREETKWSIVLIVIIFLFLLSFFIPPRKIELSGDKYFVINISEIESIPIPTNYNCQIIKKENNVEISECTAVNKDWICKMNRNYDLTKEVIESEVNCIPCMANYKDKCLISEKKIKEVKR